MQLGWKALNVVTIALCLAIACALVVFGFLTLFWRDKATVWARRWTAFYRVRAVARPGFLDQVVAPPRTAGIFILFVGLWALLPFFLRFSGHDVRAVILLTGWLVVCGGLVTFGFLTLFWRENATELARMWTSLIRMQAPDADWSSVDRGMVPPRIIGLLVMLAGLGMIYLPLNVILGR